MIIVVLLVLLPMIHMLAVSFSSDVYVMQGKVGLWPKGFTAKTYGYVFEDDRIFRSYGNTILYTVLGTTISLSITAMGAYALSAKRMIGHKFFSMMIVFTMFFQGGMIPTYLVVKSYGLLDTIWGVILPGAVSTWNFIVMRSFFDNYPSEIEESGKVDGLTDAGVFFRLVLPTSKAVLATIGLYYAVSLWNAYFIPFIYLNDPDLFSLQLILHELLSAGSSNNATVGVGDVLVVEESLKYATVLVSIAPIMCVYPFLQKSVLFARILSPSASMPTAPQWARRPRGTGLLCCAVCWRSRTPCAPYLPPLLLRMNFWKHCAPRRISTGNALPHSTWMNMWAWMQRRPKASATFCAPACSTVCPLAKYAI